MKKILCTGAGGPAGINFVQSLHAAPERMMVVGTEANEFYLHLVPLEKRYSVPRADDPSYVDRLNEIIRLEKIDFLHAQPDVEVEVVSDNRERINAEVFLPSKTAVRACQDKLASAKIWKQKNVPVARTIELRNEQDVDKAFGEFGSPIWVRAGEGAGGRGRSPAHRSQ